MKNTEQFEADIATIGYHSDYIGTAGTVRYRKVVEGIVVDEIQITRYHGIDRKEVYRNGRKTSMKAVANSIAMSVRCMEEA